MNDIYDKKIILKLTGDSQICKVTTEKRKIQKGMKKNDNGFGEGAGGHTKKRESNNKKEKE